MSKVNIAKIAKDVGICSENLVSISESLISISEERSQGRKARAGEGIHLHRGKDFPG